MIDNPDALTEIPLLCHLSDEQRDHVVNAGNQQSLGKGEILFHEGDPAPAMFALLSGSFKLVRYSPRGKEMLLHLVRPGQTFAEAALFGDRTYPATAEAVEKSTVWRLPRQHLVDVIGKAPELGLAMVASTAMWTRRLASKIDFLTLRRVEERVAIYLLGRAGGRRLAVGDEIQLTEARHLIASQCGTAPEVLSRTFKRLEDDGVIKAHRGQVEVLDPDQLHALAEWIGD